MGYICSKYLGVTARVLIGSQHRPAGPVGPVDEICIDGKPVEVSRSRFNYDLKEQIAPVEIASHHDFLIKNAFLLLAHLQCMWIILYAE